MTDKVFKTNIGFHPSLIPSCYENENFMTLRRYLDYLWFELTWLRERPHIEPKKR
jgi:hypothetical protein